MKKTLMIGVLALATLGAPMAASAQSRGHDRDHDGRYEHWERRSDQNRHDGGRYTNRERRNDDRRGQRDQWRDGRQYGHGYGNGYGYGNSYGNGYAYGHQSHWNRGAVIPYNYRRNWYVSDYGRYGYRAPPRGYGYYRTDSGDIVLAAIATGVIISLLSN